MSEYQYYEFQAIDQPIDEAGRKTLRQVSSRAEVTSTSFVNEYNYGDFRGDAHQFMKNWFDFHLYVSSWGTRSMMIRLPAHLVDRSKLLAFTFGSELVELHSAGDNIIVEFHDGDEEGQYGGWEEGPGWLSPMIPLRADILSGDWRALYLAWLWAVSMGHIRDDAYEPLPGIAPLTRALSTFAEFFRIDPDLVTAAAERPVGAASDSQLKESAHAVISSLPDSEKTSLLCRLAEGDSFVEVEIRKLIREFDDANKESQQLRTAAELLARAQEVTVERKIAEQKQAAAAREHHRQKLERERQMRIAEVATMGEGAWAELDQILVTRSGRAYDEAAERLLDLKSIADENETTDQFFVRLDGIRQKYANRQKFIERLDRFKRR